MRINNIAGLRVGTAAIREGLAHLDAALLSCRAEGLDTTADKITRLEEAVAALPANTTTIASNPTSVAAIKAMEATMPIPEESHADPLELEFKTLIDEIDAVVAGGEKQRLQTQMTRHAPVTVVGCAAVTSVSDLPFYANLKPVGSRMAYLARRLGMRPYPEDGLTGLPAKRGVYFSDGNAYYDVIEAMNRILDLLSVRQ